MASDFSGKQPALVQPRSQGLFSLGTRLALVDRTRENPKREITGFLLLLFIRVDPERYFDLSENKIINFCF